MDSQRADFLRTSSRDIFAGLVASVITIAYGLSFAALIFAPPLNTWLAYGITATFNTSAVTAAPETRFLLFDFRLVTGIDSSAMHSFTQIKRATDELGARLVLVNLSPEIKDAFRNRKFIAEDVILAYDLDRALEACEKEVIAAHLAEGATGRTLHDWLAQALGSDDYAA